MDKTVLIIDDDEDFVYLTRRHLQRLGGIGEVVHAIDGQAALDWFRECLADRPARRLPDLALVDINMPGMGGLEFLPRLAELFDGNGVVVPPPTFLMATSSDLPCDRAAAESSGLVTGYLTKPLDMAEVARVLAESKG